MRKLIILLSIICDHFLLCAENSLTQIAYFLLKKQFFSVHINPSCLYFLKLYQAYIDFYLNDFVRGEVRWEEGLHLHSQHSHSIKHSAATNLF